MLRGWAEGLASDLNALGVRAYRSDAYFFLADFAPHDATKLATRLAEQVDLRQTTGAILGLARASCGSLPRNQRKICGFWKSCEHCCEWPGFGPGNAAMVDRPAADRPSARMPCCVRS